MTGAVGQWRGTCYSAFKLRRQPCWCQWDWDSAAGSGCRLRRTGAMIGDVRAGFLYAAARRLGRRIPLDGGGSGSSSRSVRQGRARRRYDPVVQAIEECGVVLAVGGRRWVLRCKLDFDAVKRGPWASQCGVWALGPPHVQARAVETPTVIDHVHGPLVVDNAIHAPHKLLYPGLNGKAVVNTTTVCILDAYLNQLSSSLARTNCNQAFGSENVSTCCSGERSDNLLKLSEPTLERKSVTAL